MGACWQVPLPSELSFLPLLLFPDESSHLSWENLQPLVILYSWGNKGPGGQASLCPFALPESQSLRGGAVLLRRLFSTWVPLDIWEKDIQRTFCYLLKKKTRTKTKPGASHVSGLNPGVHDWMAVSMWEAIYSTLEEGVSSIYCILAVSRNVKNWSGEGVCCVFSCPVYTDLLPKTPRQRTVKPYPKIHNGDGLPARKTSMTIGFPAIPYPKETLSRV